VIQQLIPKNYQNTCVDYSIWQSSLYQNFTAGGKNALLPLVHLFPENPKILYEMHQYARIDNTKTQSELAKHGVSLTCSKEELSQRYLTYFSKHLTTLGKQDGNT